MSWKKDKFIKEVSEDMFIKGRKTKFLTRTEILYYLDRFAGITKHKTQKKTLEDLCRYGYVKQIDSNKYELLVEKLGY